MALLGSFLYYSVKKKSALHNNNGQALHLNGGAEQTFTDASSQYALITENTHTVGRETEESTITNEFPVISAGVYARVTGHKQEPRFVVVNPHSEFTREKKPGYAELIKFR